MRVMNYEIVPFAGFYKVIDTDTGERVGGLYPSRKAAEECCIEYKRSYLGITPRERR